MFDKNFINVFNVNVNFNRDNNADRNERNENRDRDNNVDRNDEDENFQLFLRKGCM